MKFSLQLLESNNEIVKNILVSLRDHLSVVFDKSKKNVLRPVQDKIKIAIESQPEYGALLSGQLKYELGIPSPDFVRSIIDIWVQSIEIQSSAVTISGNSLSGGFSINAIQSTYNDVLSSSQAVIIDKYTGSQIPWLEWLLLRGGDILVAEYEVKMGPNPRSRTGQAVMVSSNQNYSIPAKYAGTERNNWVYRAISSLDDSILDIIRNEVERNL